MKDRLTKCESSMYVGRRDIERLHYAEFRLGRVSDFLFGRCGERDVRKDTAGTKTEPQGKRGVSMKNIYLRAVRESRRESIYL